MSQAKGAESRKNTRAKKGTATTGEKDSRGISSHRKISTHS